MIVLFEDGKMSLIYLPAAESRLLVKCAHSIANINETNRSRVCLNNK